MFNSFSRSARWIAGSIIACLSVLPLAAQNSNFTINTAQGCTDTGAALKAGQTLVITATPAVNGGCDPAGVSGGSGGNLPVPNARPRALLARLEANGPAWLVGASQTLRVMGDGHLWLGVNASGTPPCQGAFSVKVEFASAGSQAAAVANSAATPANAANLNSANQTGSGTPAASKDQITDVKGALETAAQTWLSGQLGVGANAPQQQTNANGANAASSTTGVPLATIPADKISKAPLDSKLQTDVNGLPRRVNDQFNNLGDMVNFVLVGDQKKVADSLNAADWHIADRDVKESVMKAALETYEKKAYLTMPMSDLMLFGRIQDFGYEQAEPYAVVASRHHFRIWKAPFQWDGAGAGTHDIGFEKDQRNGKVTHKIDPAVDGERDNIGATLEKAGQVKKLTYYLPPNPVQESKNATGGGYHSDGRILVIELK